jgi:hypothetical protein
MASLAAISESGRSGRASEMTTRRAALAGMLALPLALAACGENFDADIQAV